MIQSRPFTNRHKLIFTLALLTLALLFTQILLLRA